MFEDYFEKIRLAADEKRKWEEAKKQAKICKVKSLLSQVNDLKEEMKSLAALFRAMETAGIDPYESESALGFKEHSNRIDIYLKNALRETVVSVMDDGNVLGLTHDGNDAMQLVSQPDVTSEQVNMVWSDVFEFVSHYGSFKADYLARIERLA